MRLAYLQEDGLRGYIDLTAKPIVIGRSPDADVTLNDDKVSRLHCGIRKVEQSFIIKDLGSRNGTYVNGAPITVPSALTPGDTIRIGTTLFNVEKRLEKGAETILQEIEEEMGQGKGYHTLLQEIVKPNQEEKD